APRPVIVREVGVIVKRVKRVLLVQCPENGRCSGLWEFPHAPLAKHESFDEGALRLPRRVLGISAKLGRELVTIRHSVTHHRITLVYFEAAYSAGRFHSDYYRMGRWVPLSRLMDYPVSAPQRLLVKALTTAAPLKRISSRQFPIST